MEHGTLSAYSNNKCRCAKCKAAQREYGIKRRAKVASGVTKVKHGTANAYKSGCRCAPCKSAHRKRVKEYRAERLERGDFAHGTSSGYTILKCRCEQCMEYGQTQRLKRYGLENAQYASMLKEQRGACASCGDEFNDARTPHIDHCHSTGEVRGLLCSPCNLALGLMQDDPQRIQGLLAFINQH